MRKDILWLNTAVLLGGLLAGHAAHAQLQLQDKLSTRIGVTTIMPDVKSGDLSAPSLVGTKIDIHNATQLTGGLNYALTDHLSIDLPLGLPFEHDIVGDGAIAGTGRLGTVKALPMTITGQYRFGAKGAMLRPYVGVGLTYARFFQAKGSSVLSGLTGGLPSKPTTLSMENASGPTAQIGIEYRINKSWSMDLVATYVKLSTTGTLSTGQKIDTRIDPTAVTFSMVHQF